ncbi:hypothetical protein ACJJTC_014415 [Scirpophaga incertulas]
MSNISNRTVKYHTFFQIHCSLGRTNLNFWKKYLPLGAMYGPLPPPAPKMPAGLVELMEGLAKDVLKSNPSDVYRFCTNHMKNLLEIRDGRPPNKKLSMEKRIKIAQEKIRQRAERRWQKYDQETKFEKHFGNCEKNYTSDNKFNINQDIKTRRHVQQDNDLDNASKEEISNDVKSDINDNSVTLTVTSNSQINDETTSSKINNSNMGHDGKTISVANNVVTENYMDGARNIISEPEAFLKTVNTSHCSQIQVKAELMIDDIVESTICQKSVKDLTKQVKVVDVIASDKIDTVLPLVETNDMFENDPNPKSDNEDNSELELKPKELSTHQYENNYKELKPNEVLEIMFKEQSKAEDTKENSVFSINSQCFDGNAEIINKSTVSNREMSKNQTNPNEVSTVEENEIKYEVQTEVLKGNTEINESEINIENTNLLYDVDGGINKIDNEIPVTSDNLEIEVIKENNKIKNPEINIEVTNVQYLGESEVSEEQNDTIELFSDADKEKNNNFAKEIKSNNETDKPEINIMSQNSESEKVNDVFCEDGSDNMNFNDNFKSHGSSEGKTSSDGIFFSRKDSRTELKQQYTFDDTCIHNDTIVSEKEINHDNANILELKNVENIDGSEKKQYLYPISNTPEGLINIINVNSNNEKKIYNNANKLDNIHENHSYLNVKAGNNLTIEENTKTKESNKNLNDANLDCDDQSNETNKTMDLETAAVTIQKVFRSFLFKSRASTFENSTTDDNLSIDENCDNKETHSYISATTNKDRRALGISRMDTVLQTVNEEKSLSLSTDDSSTLSSAATIIQAHVRGFLVRNKQNIGKIKSGNTSLVNSNGVSSTSLEDVDINKNKTILNIHIVPDSNNFLSRDESVITSMELSLDGSPPSSVNLHPLSYDLSERRKQLKREDAIQSVSPPSNNSGKLSDDIESVKELTVSNDPQTEKNVDVDIKTFEITKAISLETTPNNSITVETVVDNRKNIGSSPETSIEIDIKNKLVQQSFDEMDVVTPFTIKSSTKDPLNFPGLLHSGEFHDAVLPTRVSRSDTPVVRGE